MLTRTCSTSAAATWPQSLPRLSPRDCSLDKAAQQHPNGSWSAELLDPDGNVIFLNTYPDERERYLRAGTVIPDQTGPLT